MELQAIKHFEGKCVKLKYHNDFFLIGKILEIYQESILFKTNQAESVIALSDIKSVVESRE